MLGMTLCKANHFILGVIIVLSVILLGVAHDGVPRGGDPARPAKVIFLNQSLMPVSDNEPGLHVVDAIDEGPVPPMSMTIVVGFPPSHPQALSEFLWNLSDPSSTSYHQYLSASLFDSAYGGAILPYDTVTAYFQSFGVYNVTRASDRLTLTFQATPQMVNAAFHVTLHDYVHEGHSYYAPTTSPELPAYLASKILMVEGLSSYSQYVIHDFHELQPLLPVLTNGVCSVPCSGHVFPHGLTSASGGQLEEGPYFQVAYDELPLYSTFQSSYPKGEVIATILWSGHDSTGKPVAPFYPPDVYDYYNQTMFSGEPHATVYGVPLSGAPPPGPSAENDVSGAYGENTLDLEMAGSTAPGSSIYNVYGPSNSNTDIDADFSYILNPTNTPGLENVRVISNSWGGTDLNDSVWYSDLQEAQARGITVLAASGDSGDNPASSKWEGTPSEFPSSASFDDFGVTAVGGTTLTLNFNYSSPYYLHIASQVAWNDSQLKVGSSGGISSVFAEPSWQSWSEANNIIMGAGRGVPDIAAVANNTLVTISINGSEVSQDFGGTSVACPVEAGIVASIDNVLTANHRPGLGFLNPTLYALGTEEYDYHLSMPPLDNVTSGRNYQYQALRGYDLVTGWGSIDATNLSLLDLTQYVPIISSFTALPSNITVGNTTVLDVAFNGGHAPITYAYAGLPQGCTSINMSALICRPNVTGTFVVGVYVNDSLSHSAYATTSITVSPPVLVTVNISPQSQSVDEGRSQDFFATPVCNVGACPTGVQYVWSLSDGLGTLNQFVGPAVNFTAGNVNGTVKLVVMATLNGVSRQSNPAYITIVAPTVPPQQGGNVSAEDLLWIAMAASLIVMTIALVLVVVLRRKKKSTEHGTVSWTEGSLPSSEVCCPYCGASNWIHSTNCNSCGTLLTGEQWSQPTDPYSNMGSSPPVGYATCRQCLAQNPAEAAVCNQCESPLW